MRQRAAARRIDHLDQRIGVEVQAARLGARHRDHAGFGEAVHVERTHAVVGQQLRAQRRDVRLGAGHRQPDLQRRLLVEQDLQVAGDADECVGAERLRVIGLQGGVLGAGGSTLQPASTRASWNSRPAGVT